MWFGLENGGLSRYDGHTFETINEASPKGARLSDDHVRAICADTKRNIWIGTDGGLNQLDRDTGLIRWYRHDPKNPDSLIHDQIKSLELDAQGRLWIGTDYGLCYLDPDSERFVKIPPPTGEPVSKVHDLLSDSQGRIWAMTRRGAYRARPSALASEPLPYEANDLSPHEAYCATEDQHGRLWISTSHGCIVFDPATGSITDFPVYQADGSIRPGGGAVAATDTHGRVWFGTFSEGLIIIEPDTGEVWIRDDLPIFNGEPNPLASRAMMLDQDGRIWTGTKFHGLIYYHPDMDTFIHWSAAKFLAEEASTVTLLCVATDSKGMVWVGTHHHGGLVRLDPQTGQTTKYPAGPDDVLVQCVEELPNGEILYGGNEHLSALKPETGELRSTPVGLTMDIQQMPDGAIWLGTRHGLRALDLQKFETRPLELGDSALDASLAKLDCRSLYYDSERYLWIATRQRSVYRLDLTEKKLEKLQDIATGATTSVTEGRAIVSGSEGKIWIAAKSSGLVSFDPASRKLETYGTADGLASNTAFGVLVDANGLLWVSSDQGICSFNPTTKEAVNFGVQHGLQASVFEPNAQAVGPDGTCYFAGHNGLNGFRPSSVSTKPARGGLIFTELRIGNQTRFRDRASMPVLELEHQDNQITISYSLLDYSAHGRNRYAYRMIGLSEDWVDMGTRQTVSFNYLPHGSYRFEVRAKPPGTSWSSTSPMSAIAIQIAAPFWQTLPFRIALISLIVFLPLAVYLTLHYRAKIIRGRLETLVAERTSDLQNANEQLTIQKAEVEQSRQIIARSHDELETIVSKRTQELVAAKNHAEESDRLKSAFLSNMSHEIRTPMNAIIGFSSMIALDDISNKDREEYSAIINANCSSLLRLIDDILDLSTLEAGHMRISMQTFDLNDILRNLRDVFCNQLIEKDPDKFSLQIQGIDGAKPLFIVSDPERLRQILTNLVSNALKFTARGYVRLGYEADTENEILRIEVEDTGIGIEPRHLDSIWDRFRKIEDDNSELFRGTGLGLAITKNLVELLHGEITASSAVGEGSKFTVSLPLVQPDLSQPITKQTPVQHSATQTVATGNESSLPVVLIAEDEESNFKFLSLRIPKDRAQVIRAFNGQEAVEICQRDPSGIELVFMDIKMPVLGGKEAAAQIKQFAPQISIVANTAYASKADREAILSGDFDAYMSKPTSFEEIEKMLDQYLKQRA